MLYFHFCSVQEIFFLSFFFWLHGVRDLSSPTSPLQCKQEVSPNHGIPRKIPLTTNYNKRSLIISAINKAYMICSYRALQ